MEKMNQPDVESEWAFTVGPDDRAQRLDAFLGAQDLDLSRNHCKRLIQDGRVLVNGRTVKPSHEVRPGDRILLRLPARSSEQALEPQHMELDVLYEDEEIIVINKAPGIVVHPGAGHEEGTLVHGLLAHCPRLALQGSPLRPGIVHRLDQNTSGALVIAKTEKAYLHLIGQFKEHRVLKEYLALVYGRPSRPGGVITTLIDRHPVDRKKMAVVEGRGRTAVSEWNVEREWDEVSLLKVRIATGRTHQIRVHLSHLHHPVVGDATYGGGKRRAQAVRMVPLRQVLSQVERQMLHAWHLVLEHPVTGDCLAFTAPLPQDFALLLKRIELLSPQDNRTVQNSTPHG